jgi:pimeloyl-ACP methyl ester carboxylesterase
VETLSAQHAEFAGAHFKYSETGAGPVLLCLPSGLPGATAQSDFAPSIMALASHHRLILVDLPTPGVAEGDGAEASSAVLQQLIGSLGIGRLSIVGNGFGGEVAIHLAVAAPELVDKLVLIGPTGCRYSIFTPAPMEGIKAAQRYREAPSPERMTAVLRLLTTNAELNGEAEVKRRHEAVTRSSEAVSPGRHADAELSDVLPLASNVKAPTLLIWGREDRFVPLDHGLSLLKRIPDARFHMQPNAGHCAQLDQPDELNALIRDFLAGANAAD